MQRWYYAFYMPKTREHDDAVLWAAGCHRYATVGVPRYNTFALGFLCYVSRITEHYSVFTVVTVAGIVAGL